jgi:SM-20-related protein
MKKMQSTVEEVIYNNEALNSEEQVWFPTILRYLQNRGIGDGKHGELLRADPVVIGNFLSQEDAAALLTYTLEHEADFTPSSIIKRAKDGADRKNNQQIGIRNNNVRRPLIMTGQEERYREMISRRINEVLPDVLSKLGIEPFFIERREFQLTASNDGEFFKMHIDPDSVFSQ